MVKKGGKSEALGISGFTLAIAGFFSVIIFGPLNIIFFIIGLIFCIVQQKRNPTKIGKIGLIINVIGIIVGVLWTIVLIKVIAPIIKERLGSLLQT